VNGERRTANGERRTANGERLPPYRFSARDFLHAKKNISPPKISITNPHQRFTLIKRERS
jgi:hypothetical protein